MKILHILYQSLPQVSGSSIRSRDILMSQKEIGLDVLAVTSPFQLGISNNNIDYINNIKYIRTTKNVKNNISDKQKNIFVRILRVFKIITFTRKIYKITKKEQPDILHAHAMFFCGIPAIIVGKLLKKPVVYEFRSLWMSKKKIESNLEKYIEKVLLKLEIFILNKANIVIALNKNLKTVLIDIGVKKKIFVVPNAVNTTLINQLKENIYEIKREKINFGYIGTIAEYEGLPFLVKAFQELNKEGIDNNLLFFGKGIDLKPLKKQIELQKEIKNISYNGTIPPLKIYKAFKQIDVIINPRLKSKITDSVTPLKPLEAMAYNKIVIGSDVGGIKELIKDMYNGLLFKADDLNSLKNAIKKVISLNRSEKQKIKSNAINYVLQEKSWLNNAKLYKTVYIKILE